LYTATDGQQTGDNFVAMLLVAGQHVAWCKRGFRAHISDKAQKLKM